MEGFGEKPQLSGLGLSVNNVTYWSYLAQANGKYVWWIVGFDLVTHKLKRIPIPMWVTGGFKNRPIMYVMEGRLCACWEISDSHVVEVATLKEEGATSSWIKLHQLSHDIVLRYMKYFYDQGVPNITTKNRFAVRDTRNRDTILFIDPVQESCKDVLKLRVPNSSKIFNYTESLISPFCNDLKQI
ncbi:uncharacterized protein LOC141608647 [Silene latifolia]|uniref:uncharacterized protein LOC141608647 n=1 Tax=Silene latifolia TaxID=37657 RepID=UPI003D771FB4